MEALKKFNINHLSASSISTFIGNPSNWVLSYIYKVPFKSGASAQRGTFIEKGLNLILGDNRKVDEIIKLQLNNYTETCKEMKIKKEEYEKEYRFIEEALKILPQHFIKFGKITGYQKKIGYNYKGVDIIGYTDFEFDKPIIVDLKTSNKLNVSIGHKIAQYIYTKATNMENKLFYVQILKKTSNVMEYKLTDEDNIQIPLLIHQAIENMNYLCAIASSKEDFKRLVIPNPDDWMWKDEDKLKARKKIWGY